MSLSCHEITKIEQEYATCLLAKPKTFLRDGSFTSFKNAVDQSYLHWTLFLLFILASQMWCLARMLPLIMGDLIPETDENWENFLRLLKIEEIVFAPSCNVQLAAYLAVLVQEYLEQFTKLYDRRIIPKQHYMVHYPRQIVR